MYYAFQGEGADVQNCSMCRRDRARRFASIGTVEVLRRRHRVCRVGSSRRHTSGDVSGSRRARRLALHDAWSLEFHLDRGFREGTPHGRLGHFGVDTLQDRAAGGLAVLAIWKSLQRGRVGVAISMGLSERRFRTERTVGVDRVVRLPPDDPLLQNETGTTMAAGPIGGFMLPVSLGGGWSVAPELRVSFPFTSDGIYMDNVYLRLYSGVRVMWGF